MTVLVGEIAAAPLRVGALGLSPKNELLLRSCIRIIRTQTGRQWEFVDDSPHDVVVVAADTPAPLPADDGRPAPIVIQFFDPDQAVAARVESADEVAFATDEDVSLPAAPPQHLYSLKPPIRPDDVTRLLDAVSRQIKQIKGSARVMAPAPVPVSIAAPAPMSEAARPIAATATAAGAAEMTLDLHGVVRVLRQPRKVPYIVSADAPFLLIDPFARTWRAVKTTDDSAEPKAPEIVSMLAKGTVRYQDATPDDLALPLGRTLPLEVLLWHLGLVLHPRSLLPVVLSRGRLKLARWPDFGRIGADHHYLKISAMLASRAYDVEEVFQAIGEPRERVVAFLNACALCGLFADVPVTQTAASQPRVAPHQGGRPLGTLMQRLRGALGIGRA